MYLLSTARPRKVVILVLTIALFGALTLVPALMASGLLAYSFGLRHAFDVDHIAALLSSMF